MEVLYCPQCPNHCPQYAPRCRRGRWYFSNLNYTPDATNDPYGCGWQREYAYNDYGQDMNAPENTIPYYLRQCDYLLQYGFRDPRAFLSPLSEEERGQLAMLLYKLCESR